MRIAHLGIGFLLAPLLAFSISSAQASTILVFGQSGASPNLLTATNNGALGVAGGTALSAVDIPVTITAIDAAVATPAAAFFSLSATSVSNALVVGSGHILQDFDGSFSITGLAGGAGTNYLSGTFHDAVFGSGTGLTMTASGAGVPALTSGVISDLGQPRAVSLAFTNVTPAASVTANMTLAAFTSNVAGNFSAVPEPGTALLAMTGLLGLAARGRRRVSV